MKHLKKKHSLKEVCRRTYKENRSLELTPSPPGPRSMDSIIRSVDRRLNEDENYTVSPATSSTAASVIIDYDSNEFFPHQHLSPNLEDIAEDESDSQSSVATEPAVDPDLGTPTVRLPESPDYGPHSPSYSPVTPVAYKPPTDSKPPKGLEYLRAAAGDLDLLVGGYQGTECKTETKELLEAKPLKIEETESHSARCLFPDEKYDGQLGVQPISAAKWCSALLDQPNALELPIVYESDSPQSSGQGEVSLVHGSAALLDLTPSSTFTVEMPNDFSWCAVRTGNRLTITTYENI